MCVHAAQIYTENESESARVYHTYQPYEMKSYVKFQYNTILSIKISERKININTIHWTRMIAFIDENCVEFVHKD